MTPAPHPDDILDEMSRQKLRSVLVIGIDAGCKLVVRSTENADDTRDLAALVAMGFADRADREAHIRTLDA